LKKIFEYLLAVIALALLGGTFWYKSYYPIVEFSRMGDIKFPKGTKVLDWHDDGLEVRGKFQIESASTETFLKDNLVGERCIHNGNNRVAIQFNQTTAIAEIEIGYPDHSGDKPCLTE